MHTPPVSHPMEHFQTPTTSPSSSDIFEPPPPGTPPMPDHILPGSHHGVMPFLSLGDTRLSIRRPRGIHMVALDTSSSSVRAFDWCIHSLLRDCDDLLLIHVMQKADLESEQVDLDIVAEKLRDTFHQRMLALDPALRNVTLKVIVKIGDAKSVICDTAQETGTHTLVLGSRGMSLVKSMLIGSVSSYCTSHATMPVVVVPDRRPESPQRASMSSPARGRRSESPKHMR
ncbi:hypothetical protein HDU85_002590 [Gaertneriomyces sp. JEL0708]|nr:hypothetical protein HDU85_002590 [Gaertneriomyces sp. JEL0708]